MSSRDRRETADRQTTQYEGRSLSLPGLPALPGIPEAEEEKRYRAVAVRRSARAERALEYLRRIEPRVIELATNWFEWAARIAIFTIYFWFGLLKLINLSPATPLATALVKRTIGMQYFNDSFKALAVFECGLGILFLVPALTWICSILLIIHMGIVSSPLVVAANVAWTHPGVPTLEGQYIIKDLALIALTIGILACRRSPRGPRRSTVPS